MDFRTYLNILEQNGELVRVKKEVDAKFEIGAVTRRAADLGAAAPLFEKVKGQQMAVVSNLYGTRSRIALALGVEEKDLVGFWRKQAAVEIEPILVDDGPVHDNIMIGDAVDLGILPVPWFNHLDGGHFITAGCMISRDPSTGIRNIGIYRNQIHGRNRIGILAAPYRHVMMHRETAKKMGQSRFPVAIAIGVAPAVFQAGGADVGFGVDEMARAGGLIGDAVKLVRCKTVPLEVPADAEIVIEAEFVDDLQTEGPFGEFTGYYGTTTERAVLEVKAITYRDNAVFQAAYTGRPPNEDVVSAAVAREANLLNDVKLPGLRAIHLTDGGCGYFQAVASIDKRFEGYGKMMAMSILGTWSGRAIKSLIIVDNDVDPYNHTEVQWALATRVQPHRDVEIIKETVGIVLDPSVSEADRLSGDSRTSKMIIDATKYDARNYELEVLPHPEVFADVVKNWDRYGIK
jgi:2,5-furandicarboxylate decarboxylase 1